MKKKGGEEGKKERESPSKSREALSESQGQKYYEKLKKSPPKKASELLAKLFSLAMQDSRFRNRKENKGRLLYGIFSVVSENFKKDGLFLQDDLPEFLKSKEGLQKLLQLLKEAETLGRKFIHGFSKRTFLESLVGFLKEYAKDANLPYSFYMRYDGQKWWLLVRKQEKELQPLPPEAPEEEKEEPPPIQEEEKQLPSPEEEEKEEDVSFEEVTLLGKQALEEATFAEHFFNRIEPPSPSPFLAL